ncbi:MAG: redoxin domain-containing protein [Cyanobacteria bacterium P01_A01_bin.3]
MPDFEGIESWLNSEPLTVEDLEGQVVAVQFWTFGCINCIRTLPHITSLYSKYRDDNFTLIGVHTPEFPYERDVNNVQEALVKHGIEYPVAIDNQYKTWRAYNNRYWPHIFLADKSSQLRFHHIGEGAYEETDRRVQQLLAESIES